MKTFFFSIFSLFLAGIGLAQTIPADSLYLGQTLPGDTPRIFPLSANPEFFPAERIAISNDGKEIYYTELKGYYPVKAPRIKYYRYSDGKWTGPFNLFEGYMSPALSVTGDTMYLEKDTPVTFLSTKESSTWNTPKRILSKLDSAHYLQVTGKGNYYVSSRPKNTIGADDWCKLQFHGSDTTAVGLGMPLNTSWDNLDFFISKDETYMIVATPSGLSVSYPKEDGNWTNPRGLGPKINFGLGMWGPFVTPDNKYLFYTTGTKQDYSDVNVYWVRVDVLIDSLQHTNIPPYVKNRVKSQNGFVGNSFVFTVPDDTFFDEDGDASFTYSATLIDGNPLPSWLSFNVPTKTFSGTPTEAGEFKILVTATDRGNGSGFGAFRLLITAQPKNQERGE
jgi:hypothetical protein